MAVFQNMRRIMPTVLPRLLAVPLNQPQPEHSRQAQCSNSLTSHDDNGHGVAGVYALHQATSDGGLTIHHLRF